jgi:hypothetical protein
MNPRLVVCGVQVTGGLIVTPCSERGMPLALIRFDGRVTLRERFLSQFVANLSMRRMLAI